MYLVNEETLFKNGNIYIAYGADLPKKPFFDGRSMIISIGPSDRDYLSATCDYIELDNTLTITTVFNHIQKIFAKYEKWHQKIMNMLLNAVVVRKETLIGILILGVLNNVLLLLNIHSFYQLFILGCLLVLVVGWDYYSRSEKVATI